MTVKCLSEYEKAIIAHEYSVNKINPKALAMDFNTSLRTIGRVLEERGVAPVKRIKRIRQVQLALAFSQPLPELCFGEKLKALIKTVIQTTKNTFNVSAKQ